MENTDNNDIPGNISMRDHDRLRIVYRDWLRCQRVCAERVSDAVCIEFEWLRFNLPYWRASSRSSRMLGEIGRKCRLVKRWAAVAADSRPIYRDARSRSTLWNSGCCALSRRYA